jgi:hypothetical protein
VGYQAFSFLDVLSYGGIMRSFSCGIATLKVYLEVPNVFEVVAGREDELRGREGSC